MTPGLSFDISFQPVGSWLVTDTIYSPYSFSYTATITGTHYFRIGSSSAQPIDYYLTVTRNGATINCSNYAVSYNYLKKMQYSFLPACKTATMESPDSTLFAGLNLFYPSQLPVADIDVGCTTFVSSVNTSIILNQTGIYGVAFQSNYPANTYTIQVTPTIYINCYDNICGNGIK